MTVIIKVLKIRPTVRDISLLTFSSLNFMKRQTNRSGQAAHRTVWRFHRDVRMHPFQPSKPPPTLLWYGRTDGLSKNEIELDLTTATIMIDNLFWHLLKVVKLRGGWEHCSFFTFLKKGIDTHATMFYFQSRTTDFIIIGHCVILLSRSR